MTTITLMDIFEDIDTLTKDFFTYWESLIPDADEPDADEPDADK